MISDSATTSRIGDGTWLITRGRWSRSKAKPSSQRAERDQRARRDDAGDIGGHNGWLSRRLCTRDGVRRPAPMRSLCARDSFAND